LAQNIEAIECLQKQRADLTAEVATLKNGAQKKNLEVRQLVQKKDRQIRQLREYRRQTRDPQN
jgi:hypothetical protein